MKIFSLIFNLLLISNISSRILKYASYSQKGINRNLSEESPDIQEIDKNIDSIDTELQTEKSTPLNIEDHTEDNIVDDHIEENIVHDPIEDNIIHNHIEDNIVDPIEDNIVHDHIEDNIVDDHIEDNIVDPIEDNIVHDHIEDNVITDHSLDVDPLNSHLEEDKTLNPLKEDTTYNLVQGEENELGIKEDIQSEDEDDNLTSIQKAKKDLIEDHFLNHEDEIESILEDKQKSENEIFEKDVGIQNTLNADVNEIYKPEKTENEINLPDAFTPEDLKNDFIKKEQDKQEHAEKKENLKLEELQKSDEILSNTENISKIIGNNIDLNSLQTNKPVNIHEENILEKTDENKSKENLNIFYVDSESVADTNDPSLSTLAENLETQNQENLKEQNLQNNQENSNSVIIDNKEIDLALKKQKEEADLQIALQKLKNGNFANNISNFEKPETNPDHIIFNEDDFKEEVIDSEFNYFDENIKNEKENEEKESLKKKNLNASFNSEVAFGEDGVSFEFKRAIGVLISVFIVFV